MDIFHIIQQWGTQLHQHFPGRQKSNLVFYKKLKKTVNQWWILWDTSFSKRTLEISQSQGEFCHINFLFKLIEIKLFSMCDRCFSISKYVWDINYLLNFFQILAILILFNSMINSVGEKMTFCIFTAIVKVYHYWSHNYCFL